MDKNKYLENYYKENNPLAARLTIDKKLIKCIIICVITTLIYLFIIIFSKVSNFKGDVTFSNSITFLTIVMIVTAVIGFIGIVALILQKISPKLLSKIPFKTKQGIFNVLDIFVILPIRIVITISCSSSLFIITPVEGMSMEPTIESGEHVLVLYNKKIAKNEVVILEVNPTDNDYRSTEYFIKRVIGVPGDTIKWDEATHTFKLNGETVAPRGINQVDTNGVFYKENGIKKYLNEQNGFVIPEGYYFVMGDNRLNSTDSRQIGLIPEGNIIGVAVEHMNYIIPKGKIGEYTGK